MHVGPKHIMLLATCAVLLLVLVSDPSPPSSGGLSGASSTGSPSTVVCMVVEVQGRANGTTLTIVDSDQIQAKAFMPKSLGDPPEVGQVLVFTLAPSDRPSFFFVEGFSYP